MLIYKLHVLPVTSEVNVIENEGQKVYIKSVGGMTAQCLALSPPSKVPAMAVWTLSV